MPVNRTDTLGFAKTHGTVVGLVGAILGIFVFPTGGVKTVDGAAHVMTYETASHTALHSFVRCSIGAYCAAAGHTVGGTISDGRHKALQH